MRPDTYYRGVPGKKYGIWNSSAKCFQFNIREDTPMLAMARLHQKLGHDAKKWRFEPRMLPDPRREQTVADGIRSKTDEELAEAIYELNDRLQKGTLNDPSDLYCDGKNNCIDNDGNITCTPEMEKACVLRWLRSPAKEE